MQKQLDLRSSDLERGFTLIEVLVSLVILAIGVIGVMSIFPRAYHDITQAGRISTLNHIAYKKMDELKTLGYSDSELTGSASPGTVHSDSALSLRSGSTTLWYYPVPDPGTSEPSGNEYSDYSLKWTVISDSPISGVKTVVIEVGYDIAYNSLGVLLTTSRLNSEIARYQFCIAEN